ncbi:MAG: OmpH family outer membrane protein [Planctomycetaceae bacterium]|nr:OmpH family outer membrane protein [Planctomycetaceae bacterium]
MKKHSLLTVAALALGLFVATATVSAQAPANAAAKPAKPHQVGLIDMAHIFKNYERFKDQTESLQKAAQDAETKAQDMIKQGQTLQAQIQQFEPGTPDYNKVEEQMIALQTRLQTFRQVEQREIVRKQAELYKKIYMEVQGAVKLYADYHNYTLVMRFSRTELAESNNPQEIIQNMNRQVVFYQTRDDITDPILGYLNQQYQKSASAQ